MNLIRFAGLTVAMLAGAGCGSNGAVATRSAAKVPTIASTSPAPSVQSPTPTQVTIAPAGPRTLPIPAGTRAVTVTLLYASDSFATASADVLFRRTITDVGWIRQVESAVDALRQDGGTTQGCVLSSVNLRLDFAGPGSLATLEENSPCARASLIINGTPGPLLQSSLAGWIEQTLKISVISLPNGQPSIQVQ